jgi:alpha-N-acetylglucosaminidase
LLPTLFSQITLSPLQRPEGSDTFRITGTAGNIRIESTTDSAALFGVNWYLKYVAHLQLSTNGDQLAIHGLLPAPADAIEHSALYSYRFALNQNSDGYSTPYWGWLRWQREIDLLAASGINAMLIERGMDTVLYRTFRDFGYSDTAIRSWITLPAHQNWQLMGNMCCFNGPISRALLAKRARSAKRIVARLRELGITPVLPGYYGMVPADFAELHPEAHIIAQGNWNGFVRPAWLDPRDPLFARVAACFYMHEREVFGDTSIYDMETFQEGGTSGNVPITEAARYIQDALESAHPGARWMLLVWQDNPPVQILEGVDRRRIMIVDIEQGRTPGNNRDRDFEGSPYLFGSLWNFGGRTTLGANVYDYGVRLPELGNKSRNLAGIAVFPEGIDNNPYVFDMFTEMAWRRDSIDLQSWTAEYATRRYGAADPHAQRAWQLLLSTVYGNRADGVTDHGERDAAQESLFNAQPSLTATRASTWSPDSIRYDPQRFDRAFVELLQAAPVVRNTETYRYDLVDVARQVLANRSRLLMPQIKAAYDDKQEILFKTLAGQWQHLMELQDDLLSTNRFFMLGPWLANVPPWASSSEERSLLRYDARSILTTWGDRKASEAGLHDYGNKDWSGLTMDYYLMRWKLYFTSLDSALITNTVPEPIDWFALGDAWNRGHQTYATHPRGNSYSTALRIANELHLSQLTSMQ